MIYAVRKRNAHHTLIELTGQAALDKLNAETPDAPLTRVHPSYARQWVRNGREHETGLWFDGVRVRYAQAMEG